MTDGMENSSREYSKPRIVEMTQHQREKYNWQFVYLGADQDGMAVGGGMGHNMSHSASYSKRSFSKAAEMSARKVVQYRGSGQSADLDFSAEDRKDLLDENSPTPGKVDPKKTR